MYFVRTPYFMKRFLPFASWSSESAPNTLYLTFDDGPIPVVTPWVLDTLAEYDAKATFFCVGENIERHPNILAKILDEGHIVGSHTHNHLNGWSSDNYEYFHNVRKAAVLAGSNLFRPPYGRLKPLQARFLAKHYRIVMWDILSGDFDQTISQEQVYHNVVNHAVEGDIIVFHDSLKARENLEFALPKVLKHFSDKGFAFKTIPVASNNKPALQFQPATAI